MTREEALNEWILPALQRTWNEKKVEEILKALEQESCDDAISREEAIRIASGYCHWTNIPDELAKLPSVTPKQKMGRWELPEMAYDANIWRKCSCCGVHYECFSKYEPKSPSMYAGETFYSRKQMIFCPNCGADMRET